MDFATHIYPELAAGGFSRVDGTIALYCRVRALLRRSSQVLDFGAGRGWHLQEDPNDFRRRLATLRGDCGRVVGVDIDAGVLENPGVDEALVLDGDDRLPFADEQFDMIICDHVLEHLESPATAAAEMARVLKPGGWICGRTPNRWGYIAIGARLTPRLLHGPALRRLQPGRKEFDIFPTLYRANTRYALRSHFPVSQFEHFTFGFNAEPAYVSSTSPLWMGLWAYSRIAPEAMSAVWMVLLRKRFLSNV